MQIWVDEKRRRCCRVTNDLIWISLRLHCFNSLKLPIILGRRPSDSQQNPENYSNHTPWKGPLKKKKLGGRIKPSKWTKDYDWLLSAGLKNSPGGGVVGSLDCLRNLCRLANLLFFFFQCVQQKTCWPKLERIMYNFDDSPLLFFTLEIWVRSNSLAEFN